MKWLIRIAMYMALPVFIVSSFYAISLIPSSSAEKADGEEAVREKPLKQIQVLEVQPMPLEESILLPGTVEAYEDVNVGAGIPGIVEEVYVKEGDHVQKGQELFQIDLRSRQARLADAQAAYDLTKKNLERKKNLRQRGDVTIQEYDEAVSQEQRAAAQVRTMDVEVSLGKIFAPMSGIIDKIDADKGEYMHEGAQLARLLAMDKVKVIVGVPERHADAAARQKTANVHLEALEEIRGAALERIAFEANAQTNTFEATLVLENTDHRIRPGMIVRAEIVTKKIPNALMTPLYSLVKRETGMTVFVEENGVVHSRPVKMGAFQKQMVEIQQGLKTGDRVVVIGQQDLADGQQVQVVESIASIGELTDAAAVIQEARTQ